MKTKRAKSINKTLEKVTDFCKGSFINEVCGIIGHDSMKYIFQEGKNIANDPRSNFVLDPLQYLLFKNKYETLCIFHSHVVGDENPSEFDILMSENSCIPFLIYSLNTKKFYLYIPKNIETDLDFIKKLNSEIINYR